MATATSQVISFNFEFPNELIFQIAQGTMDGSGLSSFTMSGPNDYEVTNNSTRVFYWHQGKLFYDATYAQTYENGTYWLAFGI
jgi:hypothetical protein